MPALPPQGPARAALLGLSAMVTFAIAPERLAAQPFEYVISFDNVQVRQPGADPRSPSLAHTEHLIRETLAQESARGVQQPSLDADSASARREFGQPDPAQPPRYWGEYEYWARGDRLVRGDRWTLTGDARPPGPGRAEAPAGRRPDAPYVGLPPEPGIAPLTFGPGTGSVNPSFVENGFLVEAFWSVKTGWPDGYFVRAHFHPPDLSTGFEAQHWGNAHELHGIYIRAIDNKPFRLKSLRYRVTRNRQIPTKPNSIDGYTNFGVVVLIGTSFDPRRPIRGQFTGFPVGMAIGNDMTLPWWSLPIHGFERVTQIYIASSASVDLDDIVLVRWEEVPDAGPPSAEGTEGPSRPDGQEPGRLRR